MSPDESVCVFSDVSVFNIVFALQSLSWRALSRGSTADTASTSRCCRMAPWKAQRTKAAPSVSKGGQTLRYCCCTRVLCHAWVSTCTSRSFPCFHVKVCLNGIFLVRQINILRARRGTTTLPCFLVWFAPGSIRLKMHAHLARWTRGTAAKWDSFSLHNISQKISGTD